MYKKTLKRDWNPILPPPSPSFKHKEIKPRRLSSICPRSTSSIFGWARIWLWLSQGHFHLPLRTTLAFIFYHGEKIWGGWSLRCFYYFSRISLRCVFFLRHQCCFHFFFSPSLSEWQEHYFPFALSRGEDKSEKCGTRRSICHLSFSQSVNVVSCYHPSLAVLS